MLVPSPGSSLRAASSAMRRRGPEQGQPSSTSIPPRLESRWAERSPPTTAEEIWSCDQNINTYTGQTAWTSVTTDQYYRINKFTQN